eukprot:109894_1
MKDTKNEIGKIRKNYAISCMCGKGMVKIKHNPYRQGQTETNCLCNICDREVLKGIEFYHCAAKQCAKHMGGYDLCLACAEARKQTQNLERPSCICGNKMDAIMSFDAYPNSTRVRCNGCQQSANGVVWHCIKGYNKAHEGGH